jgi:predicted TPR repeat methyltransferase
MTETRLQAHVERFSGSAQLYEKVRPQGPPALLDILCQLAEVERPRLVVDLGSGTGLSTRFWEDRAERVIGVEPPDDMRRQAEARTTAANVEYRKGFSDDTGLEDDCADIVTCSQSFHWRRGRWAMICVHGTGAIACARE